MSMCICISRSICMSSEVKNILSCLIATANLVRQCKVELLNIGFTEEETSLSFLICKMGIITVPIIQLLCRGNK